VISTESGQQGLHQQTDRIVPHLCKQVDMIGHQAVSVEIKGTLSFLAFEQGQKLKIVIVRSENALAIIPTGDEVVEPTGYFDSGLRAIAASGYPCSVRMSVFHA
jgi:hypothetical protein